MNTMSDQPKPGERRFIVCDDQIAAKYNPPQELFFINGEWRDPAEDEFIRQENARMMGFIEQVYGKANQ